MRNKMRKVGVSEEDKGDGVKWKCRTTVANTKYLGKKGKYKRKLHFISLIQTWLYIKNCYIHPIFLRNDTQPIHVLFHSSLFY